MVRYTYLGKTVWTLRALIIWALEKLILLIMGIMGADGWREKGSRLEQDLQHNGHNMCEKLVISQLFQKCDIQSYTVQLTN